MKARYTFFAIALLASTLTLLVVSPEARSGLASISQSFFTRTGTLIHPTTLTDDLAVGGNDTAAPFYFDESAETFTITSSGTTPALDIENSGTGDDIEGSGDTWSVTKAGVGTFASLVLTTPPAVGGGWTDGGTVIYNTTATDGVAIGGTTSASPVFFGPTGTTALNFNNSTSTNDFQCTGDTCTMTKTGALTISALTCTDCLGTAHMADADHGDITWSSGVATLDADVVAAAEMADADHGDISWSSGVASVDADSVALTTDTTGNYAAGDAEAGNALTGDSPVAFFPLPCFQILQASVNPTEAGATNDYLDLLNHDGSTTEANEDVFFTAAATMEANNLRCVAATAPGVGNDAWIITVRTGAAGSLADTTVTCTIDEAATTCSDTTNAASISAGNAITIGIDSSGGGSDPDANADITCNVCLGQ